jgi:hypothetical protein
MYNIKGFMIKQKVLSMQKLQRNLVGKNCEMNRPKQTIRRKKEYGVVQYPQ